VGKTVGVSRTVQLHNSPARGRSATDSPKSWHILLCLQVNLFRDGACYEAVKLGLAIGIDVPPVLGSSSVGLLKRLSTSQVPDRTDR
jgi:hypothetical protein